MVNLTQQTRQVMHLESRYTSMRVKKDEVQELRSLVTGELVTFSCMNLLLFKEWNLVVQIQ